MFHRLFHELYQQETGKKAIWGGKPTKAYSEWIEKKKEELGLSQIVEEESHSEDTTTEEEDEKHYLTEEEIEIMENYKKDLEEMREKMEKEEIYQKSADSYGGYTFESSKDDHIIDESTLDYNKLTDEDERRRIRKNMAKAHVYLEQLGIQDMNIDPKKSIIIVPFEYEQYQFLSHIIVSSDWFIVKASIMELSEVQPLVASKIFEELLKANFISRTKASRSGRNKDIIWTPLMPPSNIALSSSGIPYLVRISSAS